jgi:mono/diheme cytochrome c family protein
MRSRTAFLMAGLVLCGNPGLLHAEQARPGGAQAAARGLAWESTRLQARIQPRQEQVALEFRFTNASGRPVTITSVTASCGCTVVRIPETPWTLQPGQKGSIPAAISVLARDDQFSKTITVVSSEGTQELEIVIVPDEARTSERTQNQLAAAADRQAVFKGQCADCHAKPAAGKKEAALFMAVCGVCHLAKSRAAFVPDLTSPPKPRSRAEWKQWITEGREGTLMPAFSKAAGGPLDAEQVDSILDFLVRVFPAKPDTEVSP